MDEAIDDGGDFRKARGFLVTFSTIVYLAWYFAINLNTFSIGGISLTPHDNVGDIWLAVAFINLYLWFRYIQNLPDNALELDDVMYGRLERLLFSMMNKYYKSAAFDDLEALIKSRSVDGKIDRNQCNLKVLMPGQNPEYVDTGTISSTTTNRDFKRTQGSFTIKYDFVIPTQTSYFNTVITPNRLLVGSCLIFNFISGGLSKPWLTNYILPLFYGYVSIGISIWCWLVVNRYLPIL